jgi:sodium/bile acid cotransporter 7
MSSSLAKHWFLALLLSGLILGFTAPDRLEPVTAWFEPRLIVAVGLFVMAWTMPGRSLVEELRRPLPSMWAVFISYGPVPACAWLLGFLAPSADLGVGLLLVSSVPCTLTSAVLWTRLAGGNEATALLTVMGTTLLSWLMTTAWLALTTGASIAIDVGPMMLDLVLTLILPAFLGQAARMSPLLGPFATRHKRPLGAIAQFCVLAIVLKAGVTVGLKLQEGGTELSPLMLLSAIGLAVALHLLALFFGLYSSRALGFDRGRQLAVAFSCSQKTLPVSLLLFDQYYKTAYPLAVLPLLFYHTGQLLLDTVIAHRLYRQAPGREDRG